MKRYVILIGLLILVAAAATSVRAQTDPPQAPLAGYELTWSTIDGGGGSSNGGGYTLDGSIGQADAGNLSGGAYTLGGGFWGGVPSLNYRVYLPLVLR
jgi:hypothetical protein